MYSDVSEWSVMSKLKSTSENYMEVKKGECSEILSFGINIIFYTHTPAIQMAAMFILLHFKHS